MTEVYFEVNQVGRADLYEIEIIEREKSPFQDIAIGRGIYGKSLFLDGVVQFSEKDEFIYHEGLVHPSAHLAKKAENILILGGGDLLAARECIKHEEVKKVDVIDIDPKVTEICSRHFEDTKKMGEHKKVNLMNTDALEYVERCTWQYDLIFMDLTDPGKSDPVFYTGEFYKKCASILSEGGIYTIYGESFENTDYYSLYVYQEFNKAVHNSYLYRTDYIPSFSTVFGYVAGSNEEFDPFEMNMERYKKVSKKMKMYSPEFHKYAFSLPVWAKDMLKNDLDFPSVFRSGFSKKEHISEKLFGG